MSVVVIDHGYKVKTLGNIEAQLWNRRTGILELFKSPTEKVRVDTHKHKVTFKEGGVRLGVFFKGTYFETYV